jgi:4-deoxy-L-threo-5-hexosulose-uronate ketol-isomerase
MQTRHLVDPGHYERMTGEELRATFLVEDLFAPDEVRLVLWEAERTILGSAVPRRRPLALEAPLELGAPFFAARRELGVVNLGAGTVTVDGQAHALGPRDGLYVGRGSREIVFASGREQEPPLLPGEPPRPRQPPVRAGVAGPGRDVKLRLPGRRERARRCAATSTRGVASRQPVSGITTSRKAASELGAAHAPAPHRDLPH